MNLNCKYKVGNYFTIGTRHFRGDMVAWYEVTKDEAGFMLEFQLLDGEFLDGFLGGMLLVNPPTHPLEALNNP